MHVSRHRRAMTLHLCHVCGRQTHPKDRFVFPVQSGSILPIRSSPGEHTRRYVANVPPTHLACAKRAQRLCPHLVTHFANPVPYPSEPSTLFPRTSVPEGLEALAATLPPNPTIIYTTLRIHGPRFTRQVEKLRSPRPTPG